MNEKYGLQIDLRSKKAVANACRKLFPQLASKSRENVIRLAAEEMGIAITASTAEQRRSTYVAARAVRNEFYVSAEWRAIRYQAIKRDHGRCTACGQSPPDVVLHVDHIKPRAYFPELALSLENLQVLCEACNMGKGAGDATNWRTPHADSYG